MYDFNIVKSVSHDAYKEITKGILTTAVESGWSSEWFDFKPTRDPVDGWVLATTVLDIDSGTIHTIVMDDVWEAMQLAVRPEAQLCQEIKLDIMAAVWEGDSGPIDAIGADAVLQLAIFGEIVYG